MHTFICPTFLARTLLYILTITLYQTILLQDVLLLVDFMAARSHPWH